MLFKLERSWFASCTDPRGLRAVVMALGLLCGPIVNATSTVLPANANGVNLSNFLGGTAYYPAYSDGNRSLIGTLDNDSSLPPVLDLTRNNASSPAPNPILLSFISNTAQFTPPAGLPPNSRLLIMVTVSAGSRIVPVPLAYYNPNIANGGGLYACNSSNACDPPTGSYYYAAGYPANNNPNVTVVLGVYPWDICQAVGNLGTITGCSGTTPTLPTATLAPQMQLTIQLAWVSANIPNIDPTQFNNQPPSGVSYVEQAAITTTFQSAGPTALNCPDSNTYAQSLYYPGDNQIFLNTSAFGVQTQSGFAPQGALLVARTGPFSTPGGTAPDVSLSGGTFLSNILTRLPLGLLNQSVQPFQNSTPATGSTQEQDYYYNLAFLGRDVAGFVVAPQPSSQQPTCYLSNVRTSQVQGFLAKSNCFIATAAFRSIDAAPVALLRRFRDEILLRHSYGREFVRWYYRWSPPAAEWLMLHPEFRYPVLLALVPLEALAWLFIHPGVFALLLAMAAAIAYAGYSRGEDDATKGASA